jgi:hypothetical protein
VDEKKLREVFRLAGRGVAVEILRDKEGNSRGFARIEYNHPIQAVQAISMLDNQIVSLISNIIKNRYCLLNKIKRL